MKKHKVKIPKGYIPGIIEYNAFIDGNGNKQYVDVRLNLVRIKKELPKTWEELGQVNGYAIQCDSDIDKMGYRSAPTNKHIWPTKELAKAALALSQLCHLRDYYNESIEIPVSHQDFYSIYKLGNGFASTNNTSRGPIVLNSTKLGIEFVKNFRDLIIEALPLL